MARNNDAGGCGCLIGALLGAGLLLSLAAWGIEILAVVMAAPAIVPYLLLKQPAQFHHDETMWLAALIAAPVVAYLLATAQLPRRAKTKLKISTDLDDAGDPSDRKARRTRRYVQTATLLAVTTVTGLVMLAHGYTATGKDAFGELVKMVSVVLVPCLLLPIAFRLWDHWSPPLGAPVTVEMVRCAERDADKKLKQLRQQNDAVRQMTRQVEECLAQARHQIVFAAMCEQHFTSFKCADLAHENYESTKDSHRFLAGIAARARATAAPRLVPLRDPQTGRRVKPQQTVLKTGAATLTARSQALAAERARGLQFVHTLNVRTGDLRDTIRDTCGRRGERWYDDLIERRGYARTTEA